VGWAVGFHEIVEALHNVLSPDARELAAQPSHALTDLPPEFVDAVRAARRGHQHLVAATDAELVTWVERHRRSKLLVLATNQTPTAWSTDQRKVLTRLDYALIIHNRDLSPTELVSAVAALLRTREPVTTVRALRHLMVSAVKAIWAQARPNRCPRPGRRSDQAPPINDRACAGPTTRSWRSPPTSSRPDCSIPPALTGSKPAVRINRSTSAPARSSSVA